MTTRKKHDHDDDDDDNNNNNVSVVRADGWGDRAEGRQRRHRTNRRDGSNRCDGSSRSDGSNRRDEPPEPQARREQPERLEQREPRARRVRPSNWRHGPDGTDGNSGAPGATGATGATGGDVSSRHPTSFTFGNPTEYGPRWRERRRYVRTRPLWSNKLAVGVIRVRAGNDLDAFGLKCAEITEVTFTFSRNRCEDRRRDRHVLAGQSEAGLQSISSVRPVSP